VTDPDQKRRHTEARRITTALRRVDTKRDALIVERNRSLVDAVRAGWSLGRAAEAFGLSKAGAAKIVTAARAKSDAR